MQTLIQQKNERIEELEEALRESVRITAQREMDMAELQAQIDASKSAVSLSLLAYIDSSSWPTVLGFFLLNAINGPGDTKKVQRNASDILALGTGALGIDPPSPISWDIGPCQHLSRDNIDVMESAVEVGVSRASAD